MNRREFLKAAAASAAAYTISKVADISVLRAAGTQPAQTEPSGLPKREYGKTGIKLSIIGFGGIVVDGAEQDHANKLVAEMIERGINYFDVAPTYGNAQEHLGPALKPYRKDAFLACKTTERTREKAAAELKASLELLKTDHVDLYQLHSVTDVKKDIDAAFAKGGVMELVQEAKKDGRILHVGFSAHSTEAALKLYPFDSALFPVNFACWFQKDFGPAILEAAKDKGCARLALKGLAHQKWPKDDPARKKYSKCWYQPLTDPDEAKLCLRWTLSQPITAAVTPGEESLMRLALEVGTNFKPVTEKEIEQVKKLAAKSAPIFPA